MNKIRFANDTEMEVSGVTQAGDNLHISIETSGMDAVIAKFKDTSATAVMRYYVGADLLRGYAGYTVLGGITYTPGVLKDVDYNVVDPTTASGFAETKVDVCTVQLIKASVVPETIVEKVASHDVDIHVLKSDMAALETTIIG